jgi:hypothetical protein
MIFLKHNFAIWRLMEQEGRHERFKRIAAKRTNEILEKIRILGNCSNKSSYEYTEEEINKIFSEIDKQLKLTKAKFLAGKRERFKL